FSSGSVLFQVHIGFARAGTAGEMQERTDANRSERAVAGGPMEQRGRLRARSRTGPQLRSSCRTPPPASLPIRTNSPAAPSRSWYQSNGRCQRHNQILDFTYFSCKVIAERTVTL